MFDKIPISTVTLTERLFQILVSFSNRDTSRNAWNCHWRSFMVDTANLSNNKFLSHKCSMTFCSLTKYNDNLPPIRLYTNPWPFYFLPNSTFYWLMRGFHRTFATGEATDSGRLLLQTPGPVPFGTCICSTCWVQSFSRTCRYFSGLCFSNIPRYFLDFASNVPWHIPAREAYMRVASPSE